MTDETKSHPIDRAIDGGISLQDFHSHKGNPDRDPDQRSHPLDGYKDFSQSRAQAQPAEAAQQPTARKTWEQAYQELPQERDRGQ
jgi:hypothetical protein